MENFILATIVTSQGIMRKIQQALEYYGNQGEWA